MKGWLGDTLHWIRVRVQPLWGRSRHSEELENEVRFHLEMETAKRRSWGLDEAAARRSARHAFGHDEEVMETVRETDGVAAVESLMTDLRYAMRLFGRRPLHSFLLVAALGSGLGAAAGIYRVAHPLLLTPLPFQEPEQLVALRQQTSSGQVVPLSLRDLQTWQQVDPSLALVEGYDPTFSTIIEPDGTRHRITGAEVTGGLFAVLGVSPVMGRSFSVEEDRPGGPAAIVLSHDLWLERFGGDRSVLGARMELSGTGYLVVGVMPSGFDFPGSARFWISAGRLESYQDPLNFDLIGVARLASGAALATAPVTPRSVGERLRQATPDRDATLEPLITPLRDLFIPVETVTATRWLLVGVLLLLSLGAGTAVHLLIARVRARESELLTRLRLGGTEGRLIRQLTTEGVVTVAVAVLFALPLAWVLHSWLAHLAQQEVPGWLLRLPGWSGLAVGATSAAVVLLFVIVMPVLVWWLGHSGRWPSVDRGGGGQAGRSAFVAAQVAVALVLLSGAIGATSALLELTQVEIGFEPEGVLAASVSFPDDAFAERETRRVTVRRLLERVAAEPGLGPVGLTLRTPVASQRIDFAVEDADAPENATPVVASFNAASPRLFETLAVPVDAGRSFTEDDGRGEPVAVVSESLARLLWPDGQVVGRALRIGQDRNTVDQESAPYRVVGVAGDILHEGYRGSPTPAVWVPYDQFPAFYATILAAVTQGEPGRAAGALTQAIHDVSPDVLIQRVEPLTSLLDDSVARPRLLARVMATLAAVAGILTVLGAYAVVVWWVDRQTREIGVRMALGATPTSIVVRVLEWVGRGTAVGLVLGLGLTWASGRLLGAMIGGESWNWTYPLVAAASIGVATLLAVFVPALRAAHTSPTEALRCE